MTLIEGIILGAVQGFTEFLPISSSGHLVLARAVLGAETAMEGGSAIFFEIAVHTATLLAVLVYFRRRLREIVAGLAAMARPSTATRANREDAKIALLILAGTVPAGLAGVLLEDAIEAAFQDPRLVLAMLCLTGAMLLATRFAPAPGAGIGLGRAVAIGIAQAAALTPGISRSGSTIATAMFMKVGGEKAAEFSFLLSIPAIAGAALLHALKTPAIEDPVPLAAGFAVAFATGFAAMMILFGILRKKALWVFGIYCIAVGSAGIAVLAIR